MKREIYPGSGLDVDRTAGPSGWHSQQPNTYNTTHQWGLLPASPTGRVESNISVLHAIRLGCSSSDIGAPLLYADPGRAVTPSPPFFVPSVLTLTYLAFAIPMSTQGLRNSTDNFYQPTYTNEMIVSLGLVSVDDDLMTN